MNKLFLLMALGGPLLASAQDITARMDTLVSAYTAQSKFNGTVLVARGQEILLEKGYGYQDVAGKVLNDKETIYQVGSVTKQFTAAMILRLQEQGKLSVTDALSKYFPDFPRAAGITIHQLLSHTAGIYNYTKDAGFMQQNAVKPATRAQMLALFKDKPLSFEPGKGWEYSNSGYMLLGYIIEDVTGKSYMQVMREQILQPLNMVHSGFDFTHLTNTHKATGYLVLDQKTAMPAGIVDSSVSFAAGALYATVGDLYKWALGTWTSTVLKPASWEMAFTPVQQRYGYGWIIDTLDGRRFTLHNGSIFGFGSFLMTVRPDTLTVILLSNKNGAYVDEIGMKLASIAYGKDVQVPGKEKVVEVPVEVLQLYTGVYDMGPDFKITVTVEDGVLRAHPQGQPNFHLQPLSDHRFLVKEVDAQVEFEKDEQGKVVQLVLYQNGRKVPAKKIE